MEIAQRVVFVRKKSKLTQTEFGKKLGVSRDVIFNIENERVKPKELFLTHLCDIFNVNKDWLLHGNGDPYCAEYEDVLLGNSIANIMKSPNATLHDIVNKLSSLDDEHLDLIDKLISALSKQ